MTDQEGIYGASGRLAKSPLGVIALFVLLVYGLACLVLVTSSGLRDLDRSLLVGFIVLFPVLIFGVFVWLVTHRANLLYGPGDFKDEAVFLAVMEPLLNAQVDRAGSGTEDAGLQVEETAAAVFAAKRRLDLNPRTRRRILWVDDRPQNNTLEREAFERLGIRVDISLNTANALDRLAHEEYGAIISDMARREGPREGYVLLESVRSGGDTSTPYFIYSISNRDDDRRYAIDQGAQGLTSRANDLFDMVMRSLI
ncbi:MAG: response regulator [Nocardioidaceae bacterium]